MREASDPRRRCRFRAADRLQFLAGHAGQHRGPGCAAAVELAEQFPHAGLHLLSAGVEVELHSGLNEVLLAHPQVVRTPLRLINTAKICPFMWISLALA